MELTWRRTCSTRGPDRVRTRSDGTGYAFLTHESRAANTQAQIGGGAKAALSDQNFVRLHARLQHYIPLGRVDTLNLRGEIGVTFADSRQHIPQDYLFRTGGAGSVRGYAYQSLGIREGSAIVGGRYLAIASAEVTHWLNESWGIAAFVDALRRDAGIAVEVVDYHEHAMGEGADAAAVAYVEARVDGDKPRWGVGIHGNIVQVTVCTGINNCYLLSKSAWGILRLFQ